MTYVEELYETRNRPIIFDIENETDISEDEKRISNSYGRSRTSDEGNEKWESNRSRRNPIELVKCLGEGEKEILPLCNKIYNEGEWLEEFMETVLLPIPKESNAKKCKEFRTISLQRFS